MNKFNLTFSGEILTGYEPADVKRSFGKMFGIDDPERLERFFSGQTIVLRRNLERKTAAHFYHQLHELGAVAALVKISDDAPEPTPPATKNSSKKAVGNPVSENGDEGKNSPVKNTTPMDAAAQIWPVSSRGRKDTNAKTPSRKSKATVAAPDTGKKTGDAAAQPLKVVTGQDASSPKPVKATGKKAKQKTKATDRKAPKSKAKTKTKEKKLKAREETARKEAALKESQQREAEQAASLKAEAEERERREAEEARRKAKEAARLKAEQEEQQRRAAEDAQRRAELEEKKQRAAKEAARLKAELAQKRQREAEAAAQHAARLQEKQHREEETERRKKEEEEKKRIAAEKARHKAELEEKLRRETEEAARKAELEEKQRREAAIAQRKAEKEERQRREAEEAKRKAEEEERKRRETEEAQRRAEEEERQRKEAEEARRKAELEEKQRREAEEAARQKAEQERLQRLEAEERTRLKNEIDKIKQQEETDIRQIRAQSQRNQEDATRNSAQRVRMLRSRGDTANDTPEPRPGESPVQAPHPVRKRQPGEPNLYKLRPFRNSKEVRSRAVSAQQLTRRSYLTGLLALIVFLVCAQRFMQTGTPDNSVGVSAVAVSSTQLLLISGDLLYLHDRSGVSTDTLPLGDLGLHSLSAPIAFGADGQLIGRGSLNAGSQEDPRSELLRCDLKEKACQQFSADGISDPDAFVVNATDGSLIVAMEGRLLKISADGKQISDREIALSDQPALYIHDGLLFMNSPEGPGIRVFRYEDDSFGEQLDEILLLPPAAVEADQSKVGDFLWSAGAWWVSLGNPESGSVGIYRFDAEWNSLGALELPSDTTEVQLTAWGEKTLVNHSENTTLTRFNVDGKAEAPYTSSSLQNHIDARQRRTEITDIVWRAALFLSLLATIACFGLGYLQSLRALVYKPGRERGADPIDDYIDAIDWVEPAANRTAQLRYRSISYGLLVLALLLLAISQNLSAWHLAALLLALSGPAIALVLFNRSPIGHIGILDKRLLLVDHAGQYHLAGGSRVQYRGALLMIDDIVVFSGNPLLPAFSPEQVAERVHPIATGGIRLDRNTVVVKMLQSRNPLALGACSIVGCLVAAALLLTLL